MKAAKQAIKFTEGSGNVFADLGLANAEELLAKAELAQKISAVIDERDFTQQEAARVLGVDQPKVSALVRGKLSGFSIERLMRFLVALGCNVEITVKPLPPGRRRAGLRVA